MEVFNKEFVHLNVWLTYDYIAILYFKGNDMMKGDMMKGENIIYKR